MTRPLMFLAILLAPVLLSAQESIWFDGTYVEAKEKAKAEDKLLLIDFYSDG